MAQAVFGSAIGRCPPSFDSGVPRVGLEHGGSVTVLTAEVHVLVLQIMLDIGFSVLDKRLRPVEEASPFAASDFDSGVPGAVDNANGIPVCLSTVRHEALEVWVGNLVAGHDLVEITPKEDLSILIFGLEVTTCNSHDTLVCTVIDVAGHGGPLGDTFDVVGHHPSILKIPSGLHAANKVDATPRANFRHFEDEDLVFFVTLSWKLVTLNICPGADSSKLGNSIHDPQPSQVLERGDLVA